MDYQQNSCKRLKGASNGVKLRISYPYLGFKLKAESLKLIAFYGIKTLNLMALKGTSIAIKLRVLTPLNA